MRRFLILGLIIFSFINLGGYFAVTASEFADPDYSIPEQIQVEITQVLSSGKESLGSDLVDFQNLEAKVLVGKSTGQTIEFKNSISNLGGGRVGFEEFVVGDQVKLNVSHIQDGETFYNIEGHVRKYGLINLLIVFILVVLVVGRLWGALSLLGLGISFLVIFKIILPLILAGTQPVIAAVLGACLIVPTTFYISHGFNKKTHVGVISTVIGLVITGFLAVYFVDATHLTGFASEEAGFLDVEKQGAVDIKGLLLAGVMIGLLGILDDVTVGQSSAVKQLKEADPKMNWRQLFHHGMEVGQDHISSMVNTLVLVYSGSALPLLLLFFTSGRGFLEVIELELIAEEIVRMLVGSIGLILAAPLATLLAAVAFSRSKNN
jgi:uncharacterized membrane protein